MVRRCSHSSERDFSTRHVEARRRELHCVGLMRRVEPVVLVVEGDLEGGHGSFDHRHTSYITACTESSGVQQPRIYELIKIFRGYILQD